METITVNMDKEQCDIYVGRPSKGVDGKFGNPIIPGLRCEECLITHTKEEDTLNCFRKYFIRKISKDIYFKEDILSLKGKRLGCFCAPKPCHSDIIIDYLRFFEAYNILVRVTTHNKMGNNKSDLAVKFAQEIFNLAYNIMLGTVT